MNISDRSIMCGWAFALGVAGAKNAQAAGFAAARFGGEQGNPMTSNPTALYYNPAAIAFSDGIHLYVAGDIALRHATWNHTAPPV